jgi:hypothetical protein
MGRFAACLLVPHIPIICPMLKVSLDLSTYKTVNLAVTDTRQWNRLPLY